MTTLLETPPAEQAGSRSPRGPSPTWRRAGLCLLPLLLIGYPWLQPESYPWLAAAIAGVALLACLALALGERPGDRGDLALALGLGLLALATYLRTLSPTTDFADSEEFQFVAYRLYFAHPPGYPVYTLLGKLATLLPVGDVAYRMNLFSACAAAAAVAMVCLIAARLSRCRPAALIGALTFAFAPAFWSQAVITEVYALNALIVGCVLYALLRWTDAAPPGQPRDPFWLAVSVFAFALGALHHLTIIFVAPVLAGAVLVNAPRTLVDPRQLARLAASCVLGLLPVLYFFWRWPAVNGTSASPVEVFKFATARGYNSLYDPGWPVRDLSRWLVYRYELSSQFSVLALALVLVGLIWLARRRTQWAVWLALIYLFYTGFRLGYNAWDGWVILMPAHMALGISLAAGLTGLAELVLRGRGERRLDARSALFWSLATLLAMTQLWRGGPAADRSRGWADYAANRRVLDLALPEGATIVVSPRLGSALLYGQLIEGARPDVHVLYADWPSGGRALRDPETVAGPLYLLGLTPEEGGDYSYRSLGPLIEVGRDPRRDPGPIAHPVGLPRLDPDAPIELLGYDLDPPAGAMPRPGDALGITLHWRAAPAGAADDRIIRLRLAQQGRPLPGAIAEPPVAGAYPISLWRAGEVVADYHRLPIDITALPGSYDLEIALAGTDSTDPGAGPAWRRIGTVEIGAAGPELAASAATPVDVAWADRVRLVGYDAPRAVRPGDPIEVVLFWRRDGPAPATPWEVHIDGGDAGRVDFPLPAPELWPEEKTIATRHAFRVPPEAGAGQIDFRLGITAAGHALPRRSAKALWASKADYRLAPIELRTALAGVDAPQTFGDGIRLVGFGTDRLARPGERLAVRLGWEAYARPSGRYRASVQLLDAEGVSRAGNDREILFGTRPTSSWRQGERFDDVVPLTIPANAPPGGYHLQVLLYDQETRERLPVLDGRGTPADDRLLFGLAVQPEVPPAVAVPVEADFGDELGLRGYTLDPGTRVQPGDPLTLTLRLTALRPPSRDYTLFAHLLKGDTLVAQWDGQPLGGAFPTRLWPPGEALDLPVGLAVPADLPPGAYRLALGWYNLATGQRLPVREAGGQAAGDPYLIDLTIPP